MEIKRINCGTGTEDYGDILISHLSKEVPQIEIKNKSVLLDVITDILYNTKNLRYGSIPPPEFQTVVRSVIKDAIQNNNPIPVLVPWGSIKTDFSGNIGVAELSAIQILICLNNQIRQYYIPGLEIALRIEDTSGFRLFSMEDNQAIIKMNSEKYSSDLKILINILSNYGIKVMRESEMDNVALFNETEEKNSEILFNYLWATKDMDLSNMSIDFPEFETLFKAGWSGIISHEQREHYLSQYRKLYHDYDEERLIKRLALYFGGSLTRHKLDMTGKLKKWNNKFIQLSFVPPIKGLPEGYNYNYLYYRTVPMNQSRTHLPPWRAKGYIRIEGRSATTKISTFSEIPEDLIKGSIILSSSVGEVEIITDYLII